MMRKKIQVLLLLVLIILISTGCFPQKKDILVGKWQRVESDNMFNGLVVNVEALDDGYRGLILEMSPEMESIGYRIGDTKWKNVKKLKSGLYVFEDLGKNTETKETLWFEMNMNISLEDPDTMTITSVANTGEVGSVQTWKRVPPPV
ncbi:hypothetical protein [Acetobacterium sp.]|uniref:hypothetical protein n=1 Tax=Acetobacterium sp. TaxID=1872094 RepID=UPI0035931D66